MLPNVGSRGARARCSECVFKKSGLVPARSRPGPARLAEGESRKTIKHCADIIKRLQRTLCEAPRGCRKGCKKGKSKFSVLYIKALWSRRAAGDSAQMIIVMMLQPKISSSRYHQWAKVITCLNYYLMHIAALIKKTLTAQQFLMS